MDGQLKWVMLSVALAVCAAVPAKREVLYYNPVQQQQQQQQQPLFFNPNPYQQSQQQSYQQPLVRSFTPQYQPQYQQQYQPQYQPQYQQQLPQQSQSPFHRVLMYSPGAGYPAAGYPAAGYPAATYPAASPPGYPAGVYPLSPGGPFLFPLRADGEGGGSPATVGGSGSGTGGWGLPNPSEYLTILQNYWQSFTGGIGTQSGKPPAEAAGAEAPTTAEGSKKPESSEAAADPMPAAPAGDAPVMHAPVMHAPAVHAPTTAQRFFVVSQPQVASSPAALPTASNGAVSTYLLLRNQPVYSFPGAGQGNAFRVQQPQPVQGVQPVQQPVLPSGSGPMILVRTPDNKYGLAPADNPNRVLVSGEGIRAQDNVQVSGPGSHALAFQRFLLTRQGQHAPGFYPAPHPGVVHSLTDESIAIDALRDSTNSSEQSSSNSTAPATSNTDEEIVDSDSEKPVSIAQAKPQAIALAGPGGVAAASPTGTALVGPGGMALAAPSATAVAGPTGGTPPIAVPSANTAAHNADAYRKWLSRKKGNAAHDDVPAVPEYLIEYGSASS